MPHLAIDSYALREVLFPDGKKERQGVAIVLQGGPFPVRALEPEMFVGDQQAVLVQVLDNGARMRGILPSPPSAGDEIIVRYDPITEGKARIERAGVRPLPKGC